MQSATLTTTTVTFLLLHFFFYSLDLIQYSFNSSLAMPLFPIALSLTNTHFPKLPLHNPSSYLSSLYKFRFLLFVFVSFVIIPRCKFQRPTRLHLSCQTLFSTFCIFIFLFFFSFFCLLRTPRNPNGQNSVYTLVYKNISK